MSSECVAVERKAPRRTMTYTFSRKLKSGSVKIKPAFKLSFKRAFARWSAVIPVDFSEVENPFKADIHIGFYLNNRAALGIPFSTSCLAKARKERGEICVRADKNWAVDLEKEKLWNNGFDLESIATHEIGHVLGLEHSEDENSIMFETFGFGERRDLIEEDVARVRKLYTN